MQVSVQGQKVDVSNALKERVSDGLVTVFDKYFGDAVHASVTFSKDGEGFRSMVSATVGKNITMQGEGRSGDAYSAFNEGLDHLAKRLRRHKRKLKDHHIQQTQREHEKANQYVLTIPDEEPETLDDVAGNDNPAVIAEQPLEIPHLSVSEAVMRLDLVEYPVLMFHNTAEDKLNVVYKRPDGNIGWIDPKN